MVTPSCCVEEYGDDTVLTLISWALMNEMQLQIVVFPIDCVLRGRVHVELKNFEEAHIFIVIYECHLTICGVNIESV